MKKLLVTSVVIAGMLGSFSCDSYGFQFQGKKIGRSAGAVVQPGENKLDLSKESITDIRSKLEMIDQQIKSKEMKIQKLQNDLNLLKQGKERIIAAVKDKIQEKEAAAASSSAAVDPGVANPDAANKADIKAALNNVKSAFSQKVKDGKAGTAAKVSLSTQAKFKVDCLKAKTMEDVEALKRTYLDMAN